MPELRFQPEIIENPRSKRIRLKVRDDGRVQAVVPRGYPRARVLAFVRSQSGWVERCLEEVERRRADRDPAIHGPRPRQIELPCVGEIWQVEYSQAGVASGTRAQSGQCLRVPDRENEPEAAHRSLRQWLYRRARAHLEPRARQLAERHGFCPGRVGVRNQKTRWGSCSSRGNLSLNIRLMFLERELVDYVLIHELCHLRHPDHSRAFWEAVEAIEPDYRHREQLLKRSGARLPAWVTED